jgi:hypothetical protein
MFTCVRISLKQKGRGTYAAYFYDHSSLLKQYKISSCLRQCCTVLSNLTLTKLCEEATATLAFLPRMFFPFRVGKILTYITISQLFA